MVSSIQKVWDLATIPIIYQGMNQDFLTLRLPYAIDNRKWLSSLGRNHPIWDAVKKVWLVPNNWFDRAISLVLSRYGKVYVIQPYREESKCAPACWNAVSLSCDCSCLGKNHGKGYPQGKWFVVSEALAIKWGEKKLSCRLIEDATETQ
jgi:hypothetical protein